MEPLKDTPCILACIAHGVQDTEWVDYIKEHPLWTVEFHGLTHSDYRRMGIEETVHDFDEGRRLLEETFGYAPTKFFAPRHRLSDITVQVALDFGMKVVEEKRTIQDYIEDPKIDRCYAHFWQPRDIARVKEVYEKS